MSKLSETPYRHNTGGMGGIRLPHLEGYAHRA